MSIHEGYIGLYRCLIDKPIWKKSTPEQKSILITLLLMVNHKESEWEWQGEKFKVMPGQTITSLDSIAKEAGKGITIQNVRTALKRFEKLEFLTNNSTKSGRLITVVNWHLYQVELLKGNKDESKDLTKSQQRGNKDLTPNKNDNNNKNDKNDKNDIIILTPEEIEFISVLKSVKDYPIDKAKDSELFKTLSSRYPETDILDCVNEWAVNKLDNPLKSNSNPRGQINTWCKKATEWGKNTKQVTGNESIVPKRYEVDSS